MREALSIIHLFKGCDQNARQAFRDEVVAAVEDGIESPLLIAGAVKNLQDILEAIQTDIKKYLIDEVAKNGGAITEYGVTFKQMEAGTKYDWSSTGDWVLGGLEAMAKSHKANIDERQKFLKGIPPDGLDVINEDTGEVVKLRAPIKTSTTTVAISLGKL